VWRAWTPVYHRYEQYGFALVLIDGEYLKGTYESWRMAPDELAYGKIMLDTVCEGIVAGGNR